MTNYRSKIIADSKSKDDQRLTGFELVYPAAYHAEMISNRQLSLTAAGGNIHKPMTTVRSIVTGTRLGWQHFFAKYSPTFLDTPPLLQELSQQMERQWVSGTPATLERNDWHLPFVDRATVEDACLVALERAPARGLEPHELDLEVTVICQKLSVVRCFSVSPIEPPFPSTRAMHAQRMAFYDVMLQHYVDLVRQFPIHSAFEHQASPDWRIEGRWQRSQYHGNFVGWQQLRMTFIEPMLDNVGLSQPEEKQVHG